MKPRKIIHLDMDCFYAAVETKFRPDLRGKPLGVGGSPNGRGVLTTANYEARAFGVRSAMASARAVKLCPQLIIVPPDFSKYRAESRKAREIFARYTDRIEPLSLDEAYLDVTGVAIEGGSATRIAMAIRQSIKDELGLTASAGVAPNKFLAKVASDMNKPDGLTVIRPEDVEAFVEVLPVEKIWGVGKVTASKMHAMGIRTCTDLQKLSLVQLNEKFGRWGNSLYNYARGVDHRLVDEHGERKSLSVEETYGRDLVQRPEIRLKLTDLYDDFRERMVKYGARAGDETAPMRSAHVKIKFTDFRVKGRERQWTEASIPPLPVFLDLLESILDGETKPLRLLGIGVKFSDSNQKPERGSGLQLSMLE